VFLPVLGVGMIMAIGMAGVGFRDAVQLAAMYANPHVTYRARFDTAGVIWQNQTGLYEIRWESISRGVRRSGVYLLGIENSRAICVLPIELLTQTARSRIDLLSKRK
jgi:hypothetical protein